MKAARRFPTGAARRLQTAPHGTFFLAVLASLPVAAQNYAGAEACRACHPTEFSLQSTTAHARALTRSTTTQPGDWAFGAGLQAITFVTHVDRENYRENGETWYRAIQDYGLTPGHSNTKGVLFRTFDPAARILRCFACHSTGPLSLGTDDTIVPHELGVRCEVCHGPAAEHVRDPSKAHLSTPAQMPAAKINEFCAKCHSIDSDTGAAITDLRDVRNLRAQPLRLAASQCFLKSAGRLNCFTCHPPHQPLNAEAAGSACVKCHASPRHGTPVVGRSCAGCHMPKVQQGNLALPNHRIAIYRTGDPLVPITSARAR